MKSYNGIDVTEDFYTFFAPYFLDILSHINDPCEQDNDNLQYSLSSYLSVMLLGICQGATPMRQMVLLGKDEAFRERVAFLCAGGKIAQAQNSYTNLVEQLDQQAFQQQYNTILHGLSHDGLLMPFTVQGLRVAALDGIELHHHLSVERHYGRTCPYCLQRIHKKGTALGCPNWFLVVDRILASRCHSRLLYPWEDSIFNEKRLLQRHDLRTAGLFITI